MYKPILDKIKEYDYITIYRHQRPDGDCMFSALALYEFLKDNYYEVVYEDSHFVLYKPGEIPEIKPEDLTEEERERLIMEIILRANTTADH